MDVDAGTEAPSRDGTTAPYPTKQSKPDFSPTHQEKFLFGTIVAVSSHITDRVPKQVKFIYCRMDSIEVNSGDNLKYVLAPLLLASTMILPAKATLKENDVAPVFNTQASLAGKTFRYSLQESLKKGPVVVYFYPSAFTGGCNLQAHTFAVKSDRFAAAGATIVGVSLDGIERLNDFSADPDFCAGKIPVASDAGGEISKSYGLNVRDAVAGRKDTRGIEIGHGFAERTTFIIGKDGKIASVVGGVAPDLNVEKALEIVQKLVHQTN